MATPASTSHQAGASATSTPTPETDANLRPAPLKTPARGAGARHPPRPANPTIAPKPVINQQKDTANALASAIQKLELEKQGAVTRDTKDLKIECRRGLRKGKGKKKGSCTCPLCVSRGDAILSEKAESTIQLLIDTCKRKGFDVSKNYAKQMLMRHGGMVLPALKDTEADLSRRERAMIASGRIAWQREKVMAEKAGYKTRDQLVAYIENDDICLKEFQQNVFASAYGKSIARIGSQEVKAKWTKMYDEECKYRDERATYYNELFKCVQDGTCTQEDMVRRLDAYDGIGHVNQDDKTTSDAPGNSGHGSLATHIRQPDNQEAVESAAGNPRQLADRVPCTAMVEYEAELEESDDYESDPCNYDSDTYTDADFDPTDYVSDNNSDAWSENEDVVANVKRFAAALCKAEKKGPPTMIDFIDARDTLIRRYRTKLSRLVPMKLFVCDACEGRFSTFRELRKHVEICDARYPEPANSKLVSPKAVPVFDFAIGKTQNHAQVRENPPSNEESRKASNIAQPLRLGGMTNTKTSQATKPPTPQVQQGVPSTNESGSTPDLSNDYLTSIDAKTALQMLLESNDKSFSDDDSLERCGPYQCDRCGGIFNNFKTLSSHLGKTRSKCNEYYKALYHTVSQQIGTLSSDVTEVEEEEIEPSSRPLIGLKNRALKISLNLESLVRELRTRAAHESYKKIAAELDAKAKQAEERTKVSPPPSKAVWIDPTVQDCDGMIPPRYVDDEDEPHMFPSFIYAEKNVCFTDELPIEETTAALDLNPWQKRLHERLRQLHEEIVDSIVDSVEELLNDEAEVGLRSDPEREDSPGDYSKEAVDHVVALCPLLYKRSMAVGQIILCAGSAALAVAFTQKMLEEIQEYLRVMGDKHLTLRAIERECWRFGMAVQHFCQFGSYELLDSAAYREASPLR
ncbi:hypothetical protein PVAG01_03518 [Phlyctema vagabunda]|uniref:C2H2-type domain-containing protein n=1 Tax=Phlyctema vagabunda TaxID=108571 RepID=A0ABR4PMC2_9HELO